MSDIKINVGVTKLHTYEEKRRLQSYTIRHRRKQDWRDANIVPLFKKDERHLASNYRPVSLTSITCKILDI